MACSSSHTKNFDVFVSFRGLDTRNSFTDHLFAALQRKGIVAFRDHQNIKKGELLEPELLQAIEGSHVFIVVFSKDYASSTWCLKELTKIFDGVEETGRSVLPIFYDVTASEVRKQSGMFGNAFAEHEERFKDDLEMVKKWREALKAIGNRSGWDVQNKPEHEEIEKIVEEVMNLLGHNQIHNQIWSFSGDLVDMDSRVKQLEELLDLSANDVVRVVGIWGMSGVGKTTLVTALFGGQFWSYDRYVPLETILGYRGFYPKIGMKVLVEKLLISYHRGKIRMHDLLKELGKSIVRQTAPKEPRKWSRLWDYKDLQKVMIENKEAKNLEAICICIEEYQEEFLQQTMKVDALSKMIHLKLLMFKNVNFSGILNYLSNELRYLHWNNYPFMSLPSTFHPDQLVELILPYSNIKELWKDTKYLPNLKSLDLRHSQSLIEMPDLSGVPHLRNLDLEGCTKIVRINPSIDTLRELVSLNLRNCKNLFLNLNIIFGLSSLESLNLTGCSKLLNTEKIDENRSSIKMLMPFYISSSWKQEDSLGLLVSYLSRFPRLFALDLSFCNLLQIPDAIGNLHSLVRLNLGGNKFVTLPNTIKQLSKLRSLNLEHCKQLKYLPELPTPKKRKNDKYYGELNTFNCPNLSEMELIYRMVFSWMIQIFEVHWQSSLSFNRLNIVIPGTEILRWFSKQNEGDSISMDPSPLMEDPNWIGVACCALLVAHHDPSNIGNRWTHLVHDSGSIGYSFQNKQVLNKTYGVLPIHLQNDLVTGELDHLLILFASREEFLLFPIEDETDMHGLNTRGFTTWILDHPNGLRLQVKSCGYRWVFKEDLQQLNPKMFRRNSSSRKRKRWVFEEDLQQLNPKMFRGNSSSRKRKRLSSD